jgi:putative DNA primase/helicase
VLDFSSPDYVPVQYHAQQPVNTFVDPLRQLFANVETVPVPTADQLLWQIGQLQASNLQGIKDVMRDIARANLDPMESGIVVDALKRQTGRSKAEVQQGINHYKKELAASAPDPTVLASDTVMRRFYGGGQFLIRNARQFWAYNGKYWEREEDDFVGSRCNAVAKDMPDAGDAAALASKTLSWLARDAAEKGDPLGLMDRRKPIINCRNGELHLEGGNVWLQDHNHMSRLTSCLDVDFDPQAKCPIWERTMFDTFANASNPMEMVRHVQEIFGYAIQPRRWIAIVLMWQGTGSNGKSATMKVLRALLGKDGYAASSLSDLEERFGISQTIGKLVYLDDDVDTGTKLPDGLLKKISEDKPVTTELKGKDHFTFMSTVVPILLVNNFPLTSDLSKGLRRRIEVIPFRREFEQSNSRDDPFEWCIANELPGILNWAIAGYKRLDARGHFLPPMDCQIAKDKWLNDANPIAAFLSEKIVKTDDGRGWISLKSIYDKFKEWAHECGHRQNATLQSFRKGVESMGYITADKNVGKVVVGVTWKEE